MSTAATKYLLAPPRAVVCLADGTELGSDQIRALPPLGSPCEFDGTKYKLVSISHVAKRRAVEAHYRFTLEPDTAKPKAKHSK